MSKLLVLDFDGTITDAEIEGAPYRQGYLEDLVILSGLPHEEVFRLAKQFEQEIMDNPQQHGWRFNGRLVAPATVDPYLRIMSVARKILDTSKSFMDLECRSRLLDGILYKYNYPKTLTAFRDGAKEVLESLAGTHTFIVTNSHTNPVRDKVRKLAPNGELDWLVERVYGRAQKYVIDNSFDRIPEEETLPGLSRPVLLRRRQYFEVIEKLLTDRNLGWSDLLVVGDIFELDLALPLHMGASVALVINQFTPDYERNFVEKHPRAHLVHDLREIPALFRQEN